MKLTYKLSKNAPIQLETGTDFTAPDITNGTDRHEQIRSTKFNQKTS